MRTLRGSHEPAEKRGQCSVHPRRPGIAGTATPLLKPWHAFAANFIDQLVDVTGADLSARFGTPPIGWGAGPGRKVFGIKPEPSSRFGPCSSLRLGVFANEACRGDGERPVRAECCGSLVLLPLR